MSVHIDLPPRPVQPAQRHVQPAPTISEEEEKAVSAADVTNPLHRSWQQGRAPRARSPDDDEDDQPDCVDRLRLWLQRWTLICVRYPLTERLAHFAYIRSLYLQTLLCLVVMMFCQIIDSDIMTFDTPVPNPLRGILIFVSIAQVALLLLAHVGLGKELGGNVRIVRPWSVWNMYLSLICVFTTLNFTCFAMSRFCFSVQGYTPRVEFLPDSDKPTDDYSIDPGAISDTDSYSDAVSVYLFMMYFSGAVLTSAGFGDIVPSLWYTQLLSNINMCVGLCYHVWVFSLALDHFMRRGTAKKRQEQMAQMKLRNLAMQKHRDAMERHMRRPSMLLLRSSDTPDESGEGSASAEPLLSPPTPVTPGASPPQHLVLTATPSSASMPRPPGSNRRPTLPPVSDEEEPSETDSVASRASSTMSSPTLPQRVLLSPPTSPARVDADLLTDDDDDEHFSTLGVLEPMDMAPAVLAIAHHTRPGLFHTPDPSLLPPPSSTAAAAVPNASVPASSSSIALSLPPSMSVAPSSRAFVRPPAFWVRWKRSPRFESCRKWVIDNLLLVEFVLQLLSSSALLILSDPFTGLHLSEGSVEYVEKISVLVVASGVLVVQLGLNLMISFRLLNKIAGGSFTEVLDEQGRIVARIPKQGVTASFLIQSYVSTILLFSSIYFFLFAFEPSHEFSLGKSLDLSVPEIWFTFIYFSTTTMTGTGFGDIFARGVISRLVALTQMMISIVYCSIIIGLGMFVLCEQLDVSAKKDLEEEERKIAAQLKEMMEARQKKTSAQSSANNSALGSPSQQPSDAMDAPPLLDFFEHHPEMMQGFPQAHEQTTQHAGV